MHCGEKGVVVKRLNEIGDRPGLYRRVSHRVVVVRRTDDDTRVGRNGLELRLDFEAAHTRHPDINDRAHQTSALVSQRMRANDRALSASTGRRQGGRLSRRRQAGQKMS